ncbi:MAG TPA: LacI family DNA-binding transcriptional regulator, partial [Solirubrobacterales bacterium]|nr:LacI family DNA-binding transcriptional regulator [Solirubrobacterales bacterium]
MSERDGNMTDGRVTLQDVASLAGVSQATAGRALGGYGSISEDSRQRVEQAATKLGYRTNAVARALASGTTNGAPQASQWRKHVTPDARIVGAAKSFLHRDHLASVRITTNASGAQTRRVTYKAFGEQAA